MNNEHSYLPPKSPKEELLGELESIKGLLEEHISDKDGSQQDSSEPTVDIPILRDIIDADPTTNNDTEEASLQVNDTFSSSELDLDAMSDQDLESLLETELNLEDLDQHVDIPIFTLATDSHDEGSNEEDNITFEDLEETLPDSTAETAPYASQTAHPSTSFDLDLLIQEIVDESIPMLESQLRERLSACSPQIIQQLAEKYLGQ